MKTIPFSKGLHDLGNGCYGYRQPDGGWALSNAGLIVSQGQALLVDTLTNLPLTREMLATMRVRVPEASRIDTLVNTHANPDHTYGNQLVDGAEIVSSRACFEEMEEQTRPNPRGNLRDEWQKFGEAGAFFNEVMFSKFSHDGVVLTLPTRTFEDELKLRVGDKEVLLMRFAPSHTKGDIVAYVPQDKTLFTGDLLFIGGHPIVRHAPYSNWIKACDRMLSWDVETVVPGHGPVTDKAGIRSVRNYLEFVHREARERYDAGMSYEEAARDIRFTSTEFADWNEAERIVFNVFTAYREFKNETGPFDQIAVLSAAARLYFDNKRSKGAH